MIKYENLREVPELAISEFQKMYNCKYEDIELDIEWQDLYLISNPMKGMPIRGLLDIASYSN
jgi:hypothetical protein